MFGEQIDLRILRRLTHDRRRQTQGELDREAEHPTFDLEEATAYLDRVREHLFRGDLPVDPTLSYLDVGCGMGRLSLGLARAGISDVTGIDLVPHNIRAAETLARRLPPHLRPRFVRSDVHDWDDDRRYDVIIVLGAMEHIRDQPRFLEWLAGRLAPGGRACVSIEPFHSPFGDHMRAFFRTPVPWAGLVFSESAILQVRRERFRPSDPASRYEEIQGGLNRVRYGAYRRNIRASGLRVVRRHVNPQLRLRRRRLPLRAASAVLTSIPGVRDYFVVCEYALLEHEDPLATGPAPPLPDSTTDRHGEAGGRRKPPPLPEGSAEDLPLPTAEGGVLIVGTRPPPYGGVSVFVDRLARYWSAQATTPVTVISPRALPGLAWRLVRRRREEVHLHSLRLPLLLLVAATGTLPRCWIYDHNHSRGIRAGSLGALALRKCLNAARGARAVSPEVEDRLRALGVDPDRLSTFTPFLPPPLAEGVVNFPESVSAWITDPGIRVVIWSAWALIEEEGLDLYGAADVAAAAGKVAELRPDVRFVFVVGRRSRGGVFERGALRTLRATPGSVVVEGGTPLWTLFPAADLYLRTTTTDGDSLSIREALLAGLRVVASDVAPRPSGVRCYAAGDVDALVQAILDELPAQTGAGSEGAKP